MLLVKSRNVSVKVLTFIKEYEIVVCMFAFSCAEIWGKTVLWLKRWYFCKDHGQLLIVMLCWWKVYKWQIIITIYTSIFFTMNFSPCFKCWFFFFFAFHLMFELDMFALRDIWCSLTSPSCPRYPNVSYCYILYNLLLVFRILFITLSSSNVSLSIECLFLHVVDSINHLHGSVFF